MATGVWFERASLSEEEPVNASSDAWSFVCDREATTIEPLVSGQQLMAPDGADGGSVNSFKSLATAGFGE